MIPSPLTSRYLISPRAYLATQLMFGAVGYVGFVGEKPFGDVTVHTITI